MDDSGTAEWETAVLEGGPAHGLRVRVADRPRVLQVSYPCEVGCGSKYPVHVEALHVYRRDPRAREEPLRYGYDEVSP
jgi:hypothetical protein